MDYWRVLAFFLIISVTSVDVCSSSSTTQNSDIGGDDSSIQQSDADHGKKHYSPNFQTAEEEDRDADISDKCCGEGDNVGPGDNSSPILRLNFAGRFLADTSTYNNYPRNFNIDTFDPVKYTAWNPKGSGDFRLFNCTVTQVCYEDGRCLQTPVEDPIVGRPIIGSDTTTAGKLVDLDTRHQEQSQIWGLVVGVDGFFKGDFVPRSFNHMHEACVGSDCDTVSWMTTLSAVWLSTLENEKCIDGPLAKRSTFIQQVRSLSCMNGFKFYVKLNVRNMVVDSKSPDYPNGRVVGTIYAVVSDPVTDPLPYGPYKRMLWSPDGGHVPFYVDTERAVLDFGNSVKLDIEGNLVKPSKGPLYLIQYEETIKGCELLKSNKLAHLGEIDGNEWFQKNAGIIEISLKDTVEKMKAEIPLAVIQQKSPTHCEPVLKEREDGLFVAAIDNRVMRKEPDGESWTMRFRTFKFGSAAEGIYIETSQTSPPDDFAITIDSSVPSEKDGITTITFQQIVQYEEPTKEWPLDGQVYKYNIKAKEGDDGIQFKVEDLMVSIHLYSEYTFTPGEVTWKEHVYPIFQQYANLYPVMKPIIDLASYEDVTRKRHLLKHAINLPERHPNYMPVTRDLSPKKLKMINDWLDNVDASSNLPLLDTTTHNLDDIDTATATEELQKTLQVALQLELTTIPPYLSALFSIKDGENREVAALIKSVVIDEMKHMALVSNILNAIGGAPNLKNPTAVPSYPAPLPGGANPGLVVKLARCSLHQIRTVFQGIERPDCRIVNSEVVQFIIDNKDDLMDKYGDKDFSENAKKIAKLCRLKTTTRPQTIGAIYIYQILCPMVMLEIHQPSLFTSSKKQITSDQWLGNKDSAPFEVNNLRTAVKAIIEITTEGEGSNPCDPFDDRGELSHFFKFAEVVHGRRLIKPDPSDTPLGQCFDDFLPCDESITCKGDGKGEPEEDAEGWTEDDAEGGTDGGTEGDAGSETKPFSFSGQLLYFSEDGVWPTISNPYTERYPPGSQVRKYSDNFNMIYTGLLKCIHEAFNGHPEKMKEDCMGMMSSLTVWGKRLVRTPIDPNRDPEVGPNAAPTFEFHGPTDE